MSETKNEKSSSWVSNLATLATIIATLATVFFTWREVDAT